ncbi:uncharacterized protein LOC114251755 [Bombyx mandarina]|uniref:Uncharacterized protein LOC114251755 n=1 Tax=Bombyx mandarina TaxID=7092 RepID=A0A6J2KP69_BOMMA|nr:uncharacterized protein LOC114251755 [Bombyx mandarina]XP_028041939.1 uncharacterized protein LOC114251755 [Bombyx mandarina]
MECEVHKEYGRGCVKSGQESRISTEYTREAKRVRATDLHLDFTCTIPDANHRRPQYSARKPEQNVDQHETSVLPLMSNMDEISYWIYTKRAPCLMNYDNLIKKQHVEAQCSKAASKSVSSAIQEVPSPKITKKRKLSILDDDSASVEKQQNLYFDVSQKHNKNTVIISKSDSVGSDVDFNIKNSPCNKKQKRSKLQGSQPTPHKKQNNIITSTPKITSLRRSLRNTKQTFNSSHLNSSFLNNTSVVNGRHLKNNLGEHNTHNYNNTTDGTSPIVDRRNMTTKNVSKKDGLNGQFEDFSDVSGLTANYIRSTKQQSRKTPRKLRVKNCRSLVKQSNQRDDDSVNVDKPMIGPPNHLPLNCSTESSNIMNAVNVKNDKTKTSKNNINIKVMDASKSVNKSQKKVDLNISFQSTSRYPKRNRNSDNSREVIYNTRSSKATGQEHSALVNSNSTEKISSLTSMNAASQEKQTPKKKRTPKKTAPNRTVATRKSERVKKDSLRDKSGFKACFSDSDNDSEPLQKKFFCS